jgi:hypothetical protein
MGEACGMHGGEKKYEISVKKPRSVETTWGGGTRNAGVMLYENWK